MCIQPASKPPAAPPAKAAAVARNGLRPFVIKMAAMAPPNGNTPSADKSAISSNLKVMYTPIAMTAHTTPWLKLDEITSRIIS